MSAWPTIPVFAAAFAKEALTHAQLRAVGQEANTTPTEAQKESGRYKKGRCSWKGLRVAIESPAGAVRSGVDANGKPWRTELKDFYGYFEGKESEADGDGVDVFFAHDGDLDSEVIFVVNQNKLDGTFDEHKLVVGVNNAAEAEKVYRRNYQKSWAGFKSVTALTLDQLKWALDHLDWSKEIKDGLFAAPENRRKAAADVVWTPNYGGGKPEGCVCKGYPEIKLRNGSGHGPDCPYHQSYLAQRGIKVAAWDPLVFVVKQAADAERPYLVAVDLDGTLAEELPEFDPKKIGPPKEGAKEWMEKLKRAGAHLFVWTVRGDTDLVKAWLREHDIPIKDVNEHKWQPPGGSDKLFADAYIDDRAHYGKDLDEAVPGILAAMGKDEEPAAPPAEKAEPGHLIMLSELRIMAGPRSLLDVLHRCSGDGEEAA